MNNTNDDSIGEYYARINRDKQKAWQRVRDAQARNADPREIARLEELAWNAGYTGD